MSCATLPRWLFVVSMFLKLMQQKYEKWRFLYNIVQNGYSFQRKISRKKEIFQRKRQRSALLRTLVVDNFLCKNHAMAGKSFSFNILHEYVSNLS